MALLAVPWTNGAQTMTTIVADGSATNDYIPIYGYWADAEQHNQIVYSEDILADMLGVTISGMKFYATDSPSWGLTATVSMGIAESSTLSAPNTTATLTQVWTGTVTFSNNEWSISFATPFTYNGGNLLLDIVTTTGSWSSGTFYGITMTNASYYQYDSWGSLTGGSQNFVPKTEFTHTIPMLSCYRPANLTASNITSSSIDIAWVDTMNTSATYSIDYWKHGGDTNTVTSNGTSYSFTGLDANSLYHFAVKAVCSSSDESLALNGSFSTACGGSTCDLSVTAAGQIGGNNYSPTLTIYQNGTELASVCNSTQNVSVCSTDTVIVLYTEASYTWYGRTATILDGGGTTLFDGSTADYSTGDTLAVITTPCPSCIPPTALQIDSVTTNEITFSWSPRSGATQFIVFLDDSIVSDNVTDTFYTFYNLSANTSYTIKIQSVCAIDDSSAIVSIGARTDCGAMDLPFFVDFEDAAYNGAWYPCWDSTIHAGTDPSVNDQPGGSYNPTQHTPGGLYAMYLQGNSNENYNLVVGPEMNAVGNQINVSFWAMINSGWIKAGVITNPRDTTTFIPLVTITSGGWAEYEFNTAALDATANYRIAWLANGSGYIGKFDDVNVTVYSGCSRPASASVDSITAHTAKLTWNAVDGASSYNVYYGTVNDATSSSLQNITVNDTTTTLTGLSGQTTYYAWVATACGSAESDLRSVGSFTTLISCPGVTGLTVDTTTSDGATVHWTAGGSETEWYLVIDSTEIGIVTDTFYTFTSLDAMTGHTVQVRAVCDADDTSAVRSTTFATKCADAVCNFTIEMADSYGDGWNNGSVNIYQAGIQVGSATLVSPSSNGSATIEVCSSAAVEVRFTAGNYPGEMSFTVRDGGGNAVYTAAQGSMSGSNDGNILATVANPCPACVPPTNVYVDNIIADGGIIHWTAQDGQSAWIVRIDSTDYYVTDTFYTIYGLDARTQYTICVATDCSGDTSNFTCISFTTDCANGSCDIVIAAQDSYGDGWNGGTLNFYQNGDLAGSYSMPGQNVYNTTIYDTATINVCSNIPVHFSWTTGSYESEVSYVIYDGGGAELYNSSNSGVNHSDSVDNACPSCLTPTNLMVSGIDSNELSFTWTVIDSVMEYLVSFNGGTWQANTTGFYNATGLNPNTAYTFSVKARCDTYDTSNARTITVKTACGQMVLPYIESFEADPVGTVPSCWMVVTPGYNGYPAVDENAHTGENSLTFNTNGGSSMIASGAIPLPCDSIYVSFWANVSNSYVGTLEAGVMTDPLYDTTFIPLLTIPAVGGYTRYEFNTSSLSNYYGSTFYLAFRHTNTSSYYYANVDDINIRLDEGCMYPTNLVATPSANDMTLTWVNSSSTANFVIQYHNAGTSTWDTTINTTDTTIIINGLSPATSYEFRVGFICGADTMWSEISATTSCAILPLEYFENFDAYANDVMPPCWEWSLTFATHWDGGVFFKSYHGGGNEYVVLPHIAGNINKYQLEFDCKVGTPDEQDGILLGIADANGTLLSWIDTIQDPNHSRNAHVHHVINMVNYPMPNGAARIAFAQYRSWNEWALIDNIHIKELPDCLPVDTLTVHNIEDPDHTSFTWASLGEEAAWQVYVDTVTSNIDSVADSLLTDVNTRSYTIPIGTIQGGGIYTFYVRANCGLDHSSWASYTFGAGTVIMNNSSVADTVVGCGLVVYDNGGPIAGYLPNSNSALVIRSENAGSELEVFGGAFGFGASAATLTIYDGEGTDGTVLYTYSTIDGRDTIDSVLATSTTGALTITFTSSGEMCHTGYELYIHCVGTALCERPTQLHAEMTYLDEADVSWHGASAAYELYYKPSGASLWSVENCTTASAHLTGLIPDTNYDLYVVGICGSETSTPSFPIVLNTHFDVVIEPCDPATDLTYSDVSTTTAVLDWTSDGSAWEIEIKHLNVTDTVNVTAKPYTLTDLLPTMQYSVRVRTVCDNIFVEPYSEWSNTVTFTTQTPDHGSIDNAENSMMALYPNPASSVVTISVAMEGQVEMNLVDMNGRVVYTQALKQSDNKTISVDVSTLAKGAYFVRIVGEQATAVRKLIVK